MNLLTGDVVDGGVKLGDYTIPVERAILAKAGSDKTVSIGVRPEAFKVSDNGLPVKVAVIEELGADAFLYGTAEHDGNHQQIVAKIGARMNVEKGSLIHLEAQTDKLHLFSGSTEERLTA